MWMKNSFPICVVKIFILNHWSICKNCLMKTNFLDRAIFSQAGTQLHLEYFSTAIDAVYYRRFSFAHLLLPHHTRSPTSIFDERKYSKVQAVHYRLRPIESVQFRLDNLGSHFIRVQIFQIDFLLTPSILSASKYFR